MTNGAQQSARNGRRSCPAAVDHRGMSRGEKWPCELTSCCKLSRVNTEDKRKTRSIRTPLVPLKIRSSVHSRFKSYLRGNEAAHNIEVHTVYREATLICR